jgi:23S rRNA-/tRNA-specific pseudouridylate synthase
MLLVLSCQSQHMPLGEVHTIAAASAVPNTVLDHNSLNLQDKVRLDAYLSAQLPDVSRAKISASIKAGLVVINRAVVSKPSYTVKAGDAISAALLPPEPCTVSQLLSVGGAVGAAFLHQQPPASC